MTTRRQILNLALGMPVLPLNAFAQSPTGKVWRVGVLVARTRPASIDADYVGGFVRGMRDLVHLQVHQLGGECRQALDLGVGKAPLEHQVFAFHVAEVAHATHEAADIVRVDRSRSGAGH